LPRLNEPVAADSPRQAALARITARRRNATQGFVKGAFGEITTHVSLYLLVDNP
jgi:hypothetical protein